ncbi:CWF19-like protein 1 homolog [Phlebotomus argentipes]|uniref:CWF19-like protein 1 homolog n=1 Tax=Phlebotomus argentipes TaxID=94469 RepID=UPI002892E67E|nr:CWF19-like protein 1 homolog [Phlebotomus argentipes]
MDNKLKILISGDVGGRFNKLFDRVNAIAKKSGQFDFLFCVGDFFGDNNEELEDYKSGAKKVPLATYILGSTQERHLPLFEDAVNGEICPNITYLGKSGIYVTSSGMKVAYVSGKEAEKSSSVAFAANDTKSVKMSCLASKSSGDYRGIDILLTSQWSHGIDGSEESSKLLSLLTMDIRPRYHFCALKDIHCEKPPFRNPADSNSQLDLATRFISLASVGNTQKLKYIYALSLTPVDKMRLTDLLQRTVDEIECPYLAVPGMLGITTSQVEEKSAQYFYDMDTERHQGKRFSQDGSGRPKKRPRQEFSQEKCWFCLSSANVEKHLIVAIGESFYIALAKGPLNEQHVLIISISHVQSVSLLPEEDFAELQRFRDALVAFFKSQDKAVCFFERNYKSSHLQVNAVPIDASSAWQLNDAFEYSAEMYKLDFEKLPKLSSASQLPSGPYFVAELPDEMTLLTRQMKNFPIHFGREVLCSENLLNCDDKIDWKECQLDVESEKEIVQRFKEEFKPFDFTV